MRDLSEEYRKAESKFLQKNRVLFEPYIEPNNGEVTEEQLVKEGNKVGCYDDLEAGGEDNITFIINQK